jgi:hypothetical protein
MGFGRTSDGAVGFVAVTLRWGLLAAMLALAGCKAVPQITGLVTGGAAGLASGSPAVGFAVGVAVDATASAGLRYVSRTWHGAEQDAIAQAAADLPEGGEASWKIEHVVPIGDENGLLRVIRVIDSPLAACKEIAFSVDEGTGDALKRMWFVTTICKQNETWKWAAAEPAVERWGNLQ